MLFGQITIVGVGLIGGSVGLAAKARGVAGRVVGVDVDPTRLGRAAERGAVDGYTTDLAAGVSEADLVVVCAAVDRIGPLVVDAARHVRRGTLITDAGSTKGNVLAAAGDRPSAGVVFVPAHPLAGSEKNGVEHARADLFDGRLTLVTPTDRTDPEAVRQVEWFWHDLGSRVLRVSADEHDRVLAATSHVPHAVAAAVAYTTPTDWLSMTAGGFRDVTRIAGGDPGLWAAIFEANRDAVLAALDRFTDRLAVFRRFLEAGDRESLGMWLFDAKQVRDALGT